MGRPPKYPLMQVQVNGPTVALLAVMRANKVAPWLRKVNRSVARWEWVEPETRTPRWGYGRRRRRRSHSQRRKVSNVRNLTVIISPAPADYIHETLPPLS